MTRRIREEQVQSLIDAARLTLVYLERPHAFGQHEDINCARRLTEALKGLADPARADRLNEEAWRELQAGHNQRAAELYFEAATYTSTHEGGEVLRQRGVEAQRAAAA